ncbi:hypothetical protein PIROE2DRAFT_7259, partial [Piromyces sp. E2]
LGGFSRRVEESIISDTEKEKNSGHPISSVLRHRRRAQPLTFKANSNSRDKTEKKVSMKCNACLRHCRIYGQNWPIRDPKHKKDQIEIVPNDKLNDFKDFFFESIRLNQIDETYDYIYDYYNRYNKNTLESKTCIDIIKDRIDKIESIKDITTKKDNKTFNENNIKSNNNNTNFINGTSKNFFSRKRKYVLEDYIKNVNKVIKKKKFTLYNSIPSVLSYDTLCYYGFSDYSLGLETDNKNHYLFALISDRIRKYETNDKTIITNINLEFIKNNHYRRKLEKYLSYNKNDHKVKDKTTILSKNIEEYKYCGINSLLEELSDIYKNYWKNIRKNEISALNEKSLHSLKLFNLNELVDCNSEYGWYRAIIKEIEFDERNNLKYYIHYENWNDS